MQRLLVIALAALAAGCPASSGECELDTECEGAVCARDATCRAASEVREVAVSWTVGGDAASESTCFAAPRLYLQFLGPTAAEELTFSPVPCELGQFLMDKLPLEYSEVEIGVEGGGRAQVVRISSSNTATADLDL